MNLLEQQKFINMGTSAYYKYIKYHNPLEPFFPVSGLLAGLNNNVRPYYTYTAKEVVKYFEYLDIPQEMLLSFEKKGISLIIDEDKSERF